MPPPRCLSLIRNLKKQNGIHQEVMLTLNNVKFENVFIWCVHEIKVFLVFVNQLYLNNLDSTLRFQQLFTTSKRVSYSPNPKLNKGKTIVQRNVTIPKINIYNKQIISMDGQLTDSAHRPTTIIPTPRVAQHNHDARHDARQLCTVPRQFAMLLFFPVCVALQLTLQLFAVGLQVCQIL